MLQSTHSGFMILSFKFIFLLVCSWTVCASLDDAEQGGAFHNDFAVPSGLVFLSKDSKDCDFIELSDRSIHSFLNTVYFQQKSKFLKFIEALFGEKGFCMTGFKDLLFEDEVIPPKIFCEEEINEPLEVLLRWQEVLRSLPTLTSKGQNHPLWSKWMEKVKRLQAHVYILSEDTLWANLSCIVGELIIDRCGLEIDPNNSPSLQLMSEIQKPWCFASDLDLEFESLACHNGRTMQILDEIYAYKHQSFPRHKGVHRSFYDIFKKFVGQVQIILGREMGHHVQLHCEVSDFNALMLALQQPEIRLESCDICIFDDAAKFQKKLSAKMSEAEREVTAYIKKAEKKKVRETMQENQENWRFWDCPLSCSNEQSDLLWSQCQILLAARIFYNQVLVKCSSLFAKELFSERNIGHLTSQMLIEAGQIKCTQDCSDVLWIKECAQVSEDLLSLVPFERKEHMASFLHCLFGKQGFCMTQAKEVFVKPESFPEEDPSRLINCGKDSFTWGRIRCAVVKALPNLTQQGEKHSLWETWLKKVENFEEVVSLSGQNIDWMSLRVVVKELMVDRYGLELPEGDGTEPKELMSQTWIPTPVVVCREKKEKKSEKTVYFYKAINKSERTMSLLKEITECKQKYKSQRRVDLGVSYLFFKNRVLEVKEALLCWLPYIESRCGCEEMHILVKALEKGRDVLERLQWSESIDHYNKKIDEIASKANDMWLCVTQVPNVSETSSGRFISIPKLTLTSDKKLFWGQINSLLAIRVFHNRVVPAIQNEKIRGIFSEGNVCAMAADLLVLLGEKAKNSFCNDDSKPELRPLFKNVSWNRTIKGHEKLKYNPFVNLEERIAVEEERHKKFLEDRGSLV